MLIIPRWMGKKGFLALSVGTLALLLLGVVLVVEFRNRNQRLLVQVREMVGSDSFLGFSQSILKDRDPLLFPLKSRIEIDQFLAENSGRLDWSENEGPELKDILANVMAYDREFLEVVKSAPARKPSVSEELHLSSFNLAGARDRLVSIMNPAVGGDDSERVVRQLVSAVEATEMLYGGSGSLIEELMRQAVLIDFCKNFTMTLNNYSVDQLETKELKSLLEVLERVESPKSAISTAIKSDILGSIELVYSDQSQYFPPGPIGYLYEPDIEFFLRYQIQLLKDLENIETVGEFSPLVDIPWYAIYTRVLVLGDSSLTRAVQESAVTAGQLHYLRDYLRIIISERDSGQKFEGDLSEFSKISTNGEEGVRTLEYLGLFSSSRHVDWEKQPLQLP